MTNRFKVLSLCAIIAALSLTASCVGVGGQDLVTYTDPASIEASFLTATPNPTDREDFTPSEFQGALCPPSSIQVLNHDPDRTEAPIDNLWIVNNCATTVTLYMCVAKGSLAQPEGGLEQCATDPLDTPYDQFTTVSITTGEFGVWYPSTGDLSVIIYYCSDGETFVAPGLADYVSCLLP